MRGFGWAYKRGGGLISAWAYIRKMFWNDEIKRIKANIPLRFELHL